MGIGVYRTVDTLKPGDRVHLDNGEVGTVKRIITDTPQPHSVRIIWAEERLNLSDRLDYLTNESVHVYPR